MPTIYSGKIRKLYVNFTECKVDIDTPDPSAPEYLVLEKEHPNYNALYSLLLAQASSGGNVSIRLIDNDPDRIQYVVGYF